MKNYITIIAASLGFIAFGLAATSCSSQNPSSGYHSMGPPGKGPRMSDDVMPGHTHN